MKKLPDLTTPQALNIDPVQAAGVLPKFEQKNVLYFNNF